MLRGIERIHDSRITMIPLTSIQVERFMEIYSDLSGKPAPLRRGRAVTNTDRESSSDTAATNAAMVPVLVWFLARVVRQVKMIEEGFAMQCAAKDLEMLGYAIRRSDLSSPACKTWQLRVAGYLCGPLLFGSCSAYETRMQGTRWGGGVHIEEFRRVIGYFLAEWRGASNVRSMVGPQLSLVLSRL